MSYDRGRLHSELEYDERLMLRVYDDATGLPLRKGDTLKGNPTIAIGRNLSDTGITEAEARAMLKRDIDVAEAELDQRIPWWRNLTDNRQRVLLNMRFNLGWPRLAKFERFLAALQAGDWDRAATEMQRSAWYDQTGQRAQRLTALMRHG